MHFLRATHNLRNDNHGVFSSNLNSSVRRAPSSSDHAAPLHRSSHGAPEQSHAHAHARAHSLDSSTIFSNLLIHNSRRACACRSKNSLDVCIACSAVRPLPAGSRTSFCSGLELRRERFSCTRNVTRTPQRVRAPRSVLLALNREMRTWPPAQRRLAGSPSAHARHGTRGTVHGNRGTCVWSVSACRSDVSGR